MEEARGGGSISHDCLSGESRLPPGLHKIFYPIITCLMCVTFQMEGTGKNDKQQNRRWGEMTDEATAFYPMPRPFCPDTANDHPVQ